MEYLQWVGRSSDAGSKWDSLGDGTAPLLDFWYRTSPQPLSPIAPFWTPERYDPPFDTSGMITVVVDDRGRLLEFAAVPPQLDASPPPGAPFDWSPIFQAAGLAMAEFSEVTPQWTPRTFAESRAAWEGSMPKRPDVKLRVEAGSYRGRPVAFKVVGPWTRPSRMVVAPPSGSRRAVSVAGTLIVLALIAGALLLVHANLKAGRADRRGANRIAIFLLAVWSVAWALGSRHWFDVNEETKRFFNLLAFALLNVGFTLLFYLALEPFVRRQSPDMLIGWARLLAGHLRDPRVGRDMLIGAAAGVFLVLAPSLDALVPVLTGAQPEQPKTSDMAYFIGARYAIADIVRVLANALQGAMIGAFMYVLLLARSFAA
jgi:serine/threonine-protein kinase